jgi:uncharacterized protein YceH (UPF0502 family)
MLLHARCLPALSTANWYAQCDCRARIQELEQEVAMLKVRLDALEGWGEEAG